MGTGDDLLRMLEPTVRPIDVGAQINRPGQVPWEQQSFEQLLSQAQVGAADNIGDDVGDSQDTPHGSATPNLLAGLNQIENASLQSLRGQHDPQAMPNGNDA